MGQAEAAGRRCSEKNALENFVEFAGKSLCRDVLRNVSPNLQKK